MNTNNAFEEFNGESLFNYMVDFNLFPIKYTHISWLKEDDNLRLLKGLRSNVSVQFNLSRYLLKKFNIAHEFDYNFEQPYKRIVFASVEEIERLALYLGIVLNEGIIRSIVTRNERAALQQCLGDEAYRFAVKKAQFISRASMGPGILIDWQKLGRFKAYLVAQGRQVIANAFSDQPAAFRQRLVLKMPTSWKKALSKVESSPLSKKECKILLVKTHKEVNRQWRHLLS